MFFKKSPSAHAEGDFLFVFNNGHIYFISMLIGAEGARLLRE
ncbi:hypothetical protein JOC76_001240 [Neobacillus cucumis]|nr:hypothetical protein [Neobacillus cucumis]